MSTDNNKHPIDELTRKLGLDPAAIIKLASNLKALGHVLERLAHI